MKELFVPVKDVEVQQTVEKTIEAARALAGKTIAIYVKWF